VSKRPKPKKKLPEPSAAELNRNLRKSAAILLRVTPADKKTITETASSLGITATELLTKSALMVAEKLGK